MGTIVEEERNEGGEIRTFVPLFLRFSNGTFITMDRPIKLYNKERVTAHGCSSERNSRNLLWGTCTKFTLWI
jgi:hypothetical protein